MRDLCGECWVCGTSLSGIGRSLKVGGQTTCMMVVKDRLNALAYRRC